MAPKVGSKKTPKGQGKYRRNFSDVAHEPDGSAPPRNPNGSFSKGFDWAGYTRGRFEYSPEEVNDLKSKVLNAYATTFSLRRAAIVADITRAQIRTWRKADPRFDQALREAYAGVVDEAEATLVEVMTDPDVPARDRTIAALGILNAHHKKYRQLKNLSADAGRPTNVTVIIGAPPQAKLPEPPKQLPPASADQEIIDLPDIFDLKDEIDAAKS